MLEHYYSLEYEKQFFNYFGHLKIGKNPTKERNSYLTMKIDFGDLETGGRFEDFQGSMHDSINGSILGFIAKYKKYQKDIVPIDVDLNLIKIYDNNSIQSFKSLTNAIELSSFKGKFYLFIDEYDASMNNLFIQDKNQLLDNLKFDENKSKNAENKESCFRRFFSAIKSAQGKGMGRVYITGVSLIALDGFTSGFNIAKDISGSPQFSSILKVKFWQHSIK